MYVHGPGPKYFMSMALGPNIIIMVMIIIVNNTRNHLDSRLEDVGAFVAPS